MSKEQAILKQESLVSSGTSSEGNSKLSSLFASLFIDDKMV